MELSISLQIASNSSSVFTSLCHYTIWCVSCAFLAVLSSTQSLYVSPFVKVPSTQRWTQLLIVCERTDTIRSHSLPVGHRLSFDWGKKAPPLRQTEAWKAFLSSTGGRLWVTISIGHGECLNTPKWPLLCMCVFQPRGCEFGDRCCCFSLVTNLVVCSLTWGQSVNKVTASRWPSRS